jgi:hypothetical protein
VRTIEEMSLAGRHRVVDGSIVTNLSTLASEFVVRLGRLEREPLTGRGIALLPMHDRSV